MSAGMIPPCTALLGTTFLDYDLDEAWVKMGFAPKPEFANHRGSIQGGILTAMLDELFSFAAFIHYKGEYETPTIQLSTQFFKAVKVEPLTGIGRVVKAGRKVVFTEAELYNAEGALCTKASASTMLIPLDFKPDHRAQ